VVHHMQELLPQDEEPEEDPEEVHGMLGMEDNSVVCHCENIKDHACSS
jgi:hypothetical protein